MMVGIFLNKEVDFCFGAGKLAPLVCLENFKESNYKWAVFLILKWEIYIL